jgi:hypothetical protein
MIFAKRALSASLAGLLCTFVMGCGSGAAPEAGVLDPGKKPGMSPVDKSGDSKTAKPAEEKPADAKPAEKAADAKPAAK